MSIKLKMNTNIRDGIEFILNQGVSPIIDFDNSRYLIDISNWELGVVHWTPFDIETQTIIGTNTYSYPYASHNIFRDAILGPISTKSPQTATDTNFPTFPVPDPAGTVIP